MTPEEVESLSLAELVAEAEDNIIAGMFSEGLRPVPLLTVSEWADTYRMLSSASSAEPGKFRTSRVPYIQEIADNLGKTSDVWKVVVMKGAQLGLTELGNNWVGYIMHLNPGPVIMVMPTDGAVKKNSRTRIKPMIDSTPALRERIAPAGSREAGNTVNEKEFPGGVLIMIGANSPTGLRSTPAGNIFLDEVDGYPDSAGDEGSPIDLAEARASTFSSKKIFVISTPTIEGESVVAAEFEEGDKRYYNVPCIHCKELFVLKFEYLSWDEGQPETAKMYCPECGGPHEERHKTYMLDPENGAKWVATARPSDPLIRSYHLSGLYSPAGWLSWVQVARKFERIKGDVNKEKTFVNTVLGETYKIKGESPDHDNLYNRREDYPIGIVPNGVYFLTMGVDVQQDRLECGVVGWGRGRESWDIEYKNLVGDTSKPEVWDQLRELVNHHYAHEDGTIMPIRLTCVDSGFNTKKVYDFCASMGYDRCIPVKGDDKLDIMVSAPKTVNLSKAGKKIGSAKVWRVGVSLIKSELYGFLKLKATRHEDGTETYPEGYCHFPQYSENYFKMLTAEELRQVENKTTKKISYQWVKKFERNEALDIRVYARAASYIVGIDRFKESTWDKIKNQSRIRQETPDATPTPKGSRAGRQGGRSGRSGGWFDRKR
jgi:phage terminase large subunit GpA-like protein